MQFIKFVSWSESIELEPYDRCLQNDGCAGETFGLNDRRQKPTSESTDTCTKKAVLVVKVCEKWGPARQVQWVGTMMVMLFDVFYVFLSTFIIISLSFFFYIFVFLSLFFPVFADELKARENIKAIPGSIRRPLPAEFDQTN